MILLERLLKVAIILIPVIVIPWTGVTDQFYFPKAFVLWLIGISLLCWIVFKGGYTSIINLPKWLLIPIGVFLFAVLLSASLSPHQQIVWDGLLWRHEGVYTLLCYILLFVLSANLNTVSTTSIFDAIILTSSVVSLIGLLQYYNVQIIPQDTLRYSWTRIYSTIGNANWLASLLLLALPLTFYKASTSSNHFYKIALLLISACLFATGSRGAYLALFIMAIAIILSKWNSLIRSSRKLILPACVVLIGFSITCIPNYYPLQRIYSTSTNINSALVNNDMAAGEYRWHLFSEAVKMIPNYVFMGSGPDTFGKEFDQESTWHIMERDGIKKSHRVKILKAHNEYLQLAVTIGFLGSLSYIFISYSIVFRLLRLRDWRSTAIASGLLAYLIQLLFTNSSIGPAVVFWILLGIGVQKANSGLKKHIVR
ncbi:MAG: O-antigen ligase family protein [Bacteroidia bacterium]|nr:O-antigen ligase family protein [Bacteroidia bacterium]NNF30076.1 O-antigen ligase family protein [Flavobacteriaceae bacterium]NNK53258.1 O-antigen ligase family protein [Flavobacteriaceae bacterium]